MANTLCRRGPLLRSLSGLQLGNQLRREATVNNLLNRRLPSRTALYAAASPRSNRSSLKPQTVRCEAAERFNGSRSGAGSNPRLSVFGSPRPSIVQNPSAHTPLHVTRARRGFLSELQSIKDEENVAGPISYESPLDIVLYPDPRLRAPNKRVNVFDESLQKLVAEMFDVMYRTEGVGLSAPQVGVNVRLMVYNPVGERGKGVEMVLVNPRIVKYAKARDVIEEGCLSFPKIYADVERPMGVKVDAQDINGRKFSISLKEWQARIFQHEYDHLEGTLYFDRMTPEVLDTIRSKLIELEDKYAEATGAPPPETVSKRPVAAKTADADTDGTVPNTLVVSNAYVVKPRVAAPRDICRFKYDRRSPFVRKFKTIVHPGEVNRIRELVQNRNIIFTHTDSPDVLMWHVERHPFCTPSFNTPASTPDLILVGHTEDAEFAMATSPVAPLVISGGKDCNVLLWNVADHVTSLQSTAALRKPHLTAKPKAKAAAASSVPSRAGPAAPLSSRARADSPARSGGRGGGAGGDGESTSGDAEKKRKREEGVGKEGETKEGEKEDGGGEGEKRGRGLEGSGKKEEKEEEGKEGRGGKQEVAKRENGEEGKLEEDKVEEGEKKVVKEEEGKGKEEDGEEKEGEEKEKEGEGKEKEEGTKGEEESKEKGSEGEVKVVEGEGKAEDGAETKEETEGKKAGGEEAGSKDEEKKKEGGDDAETPASAAPAGADADKPAEAVNESEGMEVDKAGSEKPGGEGGAVGKEEVKEEEAIEEKKEGKSKEGRTVRKEDGAPTGMVIDEATGGGAGAAAAAPGDDEAEADAHGAGKPTAATRSSSPSPPLKLGSAPKSTSLAPRGVFKGHTATVEDVCFHPSHSQQFCSVGDDHRLLLWDARTGGEKGPCQRVEKAHDADVHCVDWNGRNENLVVTGGADKSVRLFDWCPDSPTVFASCAEDGLVNIWDCSLLHVEAVKSSRADGVPPGLLFQHVGHQDRVIEFQWAPKDPWTFASVSSNVNKRRGGGTLQMWRVLDLIYRPAKDVVIDLNRYSPNASGGMAMSTDMVLPGTVLHTDLAQELASRGFVDNLRPPMAAAAELLSAVGRSGDGSNEDEDVELWLVQMPDAKSLDLRALDGAQLHVQAGARGEAGAQGDGRRVEPITELALVSDPLPRGGLVAVLPGCDGRPPIVRPITRSVTCVSAAAVPQPESTPALLQESLSAKKKAKQKRLADKAELGEKAETPKMKKKQKADAEEHAGGSEGLLEGRGKVLSGPFVPIAADADTIDDSEEPRQDISHPRRLHHSGPINIGNRKKAIFAAALEARQAKRSGTADGAAAAAAAAAVSAAEGVVAAETGSSGDASVAGDAGRCAVAGSGSSGAEGEADDGGRYVATVAEASSPPNPLSPLSDGSSDSYSTSPPHALDRSVTEPSQHKSTLSPTSAIQGTNAEAEGVEDAEEGERGQEEGAGKGLGAGVVRLHTKISKAVDKRMSARGGEAGFTFMRGLNGRRRDRKGGSGASPLDLGRGEGEGGGAGGGAGAGGGGAGGLRFLSPGMARNHSVPVGAGESARPPKVDKVVYGPPVRVPIDPSRPIALSIRPRPRSGALPQGTPHGSRTCLLVTLDSMIFLVTDDGIRVWDIQHVMTAQGASGFGNPRGDEEAAAFFWVPFGAGVSAAKSIVADIKGRMVLTGHRDGRVLVWKVRERGAEREGVTEGEGAAQAQGSSSGRGAGGGWVKASGGAAIGKDDSGGGGGEKEPGWKVWVELVAEWQAHTTTVTALVVTSYDPATGQVWSIGAASISIWDARKRALVCHVKVKDEERAAADTSSGAVASGANSATSAPTANGNGEAPVVAGTPATGEEELSSSSSSASTSYSSSSSRPPKRKLHAVAPAGDGTVWIGHGSGMLRQYDWAGGRLQEVVMEAGVCCLCVVGLRLWVGTADGNITVLHVRTGRQIGAWQAHSHPPCSKATAKAARAAASATATPFPSSGTASDLSQPSDDAALSSQGSSAAAAAAAAAAATPAAIRQLARCSSFIVCVSRTGQVSAWLAAIPGPVDPTLRATLSSSSALFTSRQRFRLAACTWNVGEERAVQRSVEAWLGEVAGDGAEGEEGADGADQTDGAGGADVGNCGGGADIVAVGLQEVEMNAGAIAIAAAKESVRLGLQERGSALGAHWVATIGAALASRGAFVRIVSRQMAGILITVWARASFAPLIRDVEVGAVPRGFGRTLGNKGAVAVRMSVCGRSVAVISCHLAAHMEGVAKRNEDWRRIYRHLSFYRPQTTLAAASSAAKAAGGGLKASRDDDWRCIYCHLSFYRPPTTLALTASSAAKAAGGGLKGEDLEDMTTPELAEADLLVWMSDLSYRVEGVSHEHARLQVTARTSLTIPPITHPSFQDLEEMKTPELAEADLLVWMGDLNYRVEGVSHEHARNQVAARNLPALLANDQLLKEMAGGRAFRGMEEGLIAFPPTYKFDRGTPDPLAYDSGEKRRVPAWCDRVLFRDSFTPSLPPALPPTLGPSLPPTLGPSLPPILAPSLPLSLSLPAAPNNPSQPLGGSGRGDWQRGKMVRAGGGFPLWLKVLPGAGILIAGGSMTINFCVSTSHAAPPVSPANTEHTENKGHTEQHEQHKLDSTLLLQPEEVKPVGRSGEETEVGQEQPRSLAMTARTSRIPAFGDWALDDYDDSQGDGSERRLKYTHEFALLRQKPRGPPSPHSLLLDAASFDSATPSLPPLSSTPSAASASSAASDASVVSASSFDTSSRHSRGSSRDCNGVDKSPPATTRDANAKIHDDVDRILASTSALSPVSPAADTCLFPQWAPILPQRRISQGRKGGFLTASSSRSSGKAVSRSNSSGSSGSGGSGGSSKNASKRRELPVLLSASQLDQLNMPPPPPLLPLSASSSLQASDSGADSTDALIVANDADDSSSLAKHRTAECASPSRPRDDHSGSDSPSFDSPPLPRYSFTFHTPAPGEICASGASCADSSAPGATSGEASPGEAAERVRQRLRNSRSLRISVSRQLMDSSNSAPSSPVRASGAFGSPFGSPSAFPCENGASATPGRRGSRAQDAAAADRCWDDSSVLALLEHSRLCRQEVVQLLGLCQPGLAPLAPSAQPAPVAPVAAAAPTTPAAPRAPDAPGAPVVSSAGLMKEISGGERQAEAPALVPTAGGTGEAELKGATACDQSRAEQPRAMIGSTTPRRTHAEEIENLLSASVAARAGAGADGSVVPCMGGIGGTGRAALRVAPAPSDPSSAAPSPAPHSVAPVQPRGRAVPPTMSSALKYNAGAEDKGFSVMFAEMRQRRQQEKAAAEATGAAAAGVAGDSEENKIHGTTVAAGSCGEMSADSSSRPKGKAACGSSKGLQWIGVRADDMDFILKELAEAAMGGGEEVAGFDEFGGEEGETDGTEEEAGGSSESDYVSEETSDCDCSEAERRDNELIAVLRKAQGRDWCCACGREGEAGQHLAVMVEVEDNKHQVHWLRRTQSRTKAAFRKLRQLVLGRPAQIMP
ncbi:unnamed protein product [Closterium sp. Yama58-4]|nr:unnamed protein product [Closterium sp. Yama58-4]